MSIFRVKRSDYKINLTKLLRGFTNPEKYKFLINQLCCIKETTQVFILLGLRFVRSMVF